MACEHLTRLNCYTSQPPMNDFVLFCTSLLIQVHMV